MFNLVKMDIRRLFKSRNFYIMLAVTAGLLMMMVCLVAMVADPETMDAMQAQGAEITEEDMEMSRQIHNMSSLDFIHECLSSGFLLIITGIGMSIRASGDFSSGYIKNICFARPRRRDYVISKILTAGVYSAAVTAAGIVFSLTASLLFGLHPDASPILSVLQYAFWHWLPNWAVGVMALFLAALTRSSVLGITLSVLCGGGVIAELVALVCQRLQWPALEQYLLSSLIRSQTVPLPGARQMAMILACSIGWAAVYTAGSLLSMEKRDI